MNKTLNIALRSSNGVFHNGGGPIYDGVMFHFSTEKEAETTEEEVGSLVSPLHRPASQRRQVSVQLSACT